MLTFIFLQQKEVNESCGEEKGTASQSMKRRGSVLALFICLFVFFVASLLYICNKKEANESCGGGKTTAASQFCSYTT